MSRNEKRKGREKISEIDDRVSSDGVVIVMRESCRRMKCSLVLSARKASGSCSPIVNTYLQTKHTHNTPHALTTLSLSLTHTHTLFSNREKERIPRTQIYFYCLSPYILSLVFCSTHIRQLNSRIFLSSFTFTLILFFSLRNECE